MRKASAGFLVTCALLGAGCVLPYRFPGPQDPHAVVKVRRVYHASAGTHLSETFHVDQHVALDRTVDAERTAPATTAIRVHPRPAPWSAGGDFHHFETHVVQEAYTVQIPQYSTRTESYSCGSSYGSYSSFQMCTRSVPVTTYRSETRYRTVSRTVPVTDAACRLAFEFAPHAGQTYLLQYTFVANDVCSVTCLKQAAGTTGDLKNAPCTRAEFAPGGAAQ